jgi:hypothetical protein
MTLINKTTHSLNLIKNNSQTNPNPPTPFPLNTQSSSHTTNKPNIKNLINITSLNIQGNDYSSKIAAISLSIGPRSIFCCNEMKQSPLHPFPKRIANNLLISSAPDTTSKNGTCILIGLHLISHIHNSFSTSPYWCAIHFKFKPKIDLLVISLYLPHDDNDRKIATLSLIRFLHKHNGKLLILCGDFNFYPIGTPAINAPTTNSKRKIYRYLQSMVDIAKVTNQENNYTHITKTSMARIDQF